MEDSAWKAARSFGDLCDTMTAFCRGEIFDTPIHGGPLEDESDSIRDELILLNKSGLLTTCSQPGMMISNEYWQRAFLTAFIGSKEEAEVLAYMLITTEIYIADYHHFEPEYFPGSIAHRQIPVAFDKEPCLWVSNGQKDDLRHFMAANENAYEILAECPWLVFVDFCWGRNDMFRKIAEAMVKIASCR